MPSTFKQARQLRTTQQGAMKPNRTLKTSALVMNRINLKRKEISTDATKVNNLRLYWTNRLLSESRITVQV